MIKYTKLKEQIQEEKNEKEETTLVTENKDDDNGMNENTDTSNVDNTEVKNNIETIEEVKDSKTEKTEHKKSLIDVIVEKKVHDHLKILQQQFDAKLESYKTHIEQLENKKVANDQ